MCKTPSLPILHLICCHHGNAYTGTLGRTRTRHHSSQYTCLYWSDCIPLLNVMKFEVYVFHSGPVKFINRCSWSRWVPPVWNTHDTKNAHDMPKQSKQFLLACVQEVLTQYGPRVKLSAVRKLFLCSLDDEAAVILWS